MKVMGLVRQVPSKVNPISGEVEEVMVIDFDMVLE